MKQTTLRLAALVMLLAGSATATQAQSDPINVVTSAVPFLRISLQNIPADSYARFLMLVSVF